MSTRDVMEIDLDSEATTTTTTSDELTTFRSQLETAVHYTVGQICEDIASTKRECGSFTPHYIAALSKLTLQQMKLFAQDLEAFAHHAGRSVVNENDVKLLVR